MLKFISESKMVSYNRWFLLLSAVIVFCFILSSDVFADDKNKIRDESLQQVENNPLLQDLTLPRFDLILPGHFKPAIIKGIKENKVTIEKLLVQEKYTWSSFIAPLDEANHRLDLIWNTIQHLNEIVGKEGVKKSHEECALLITKYLSEVAQDVRIHNALEQIVKSKEYESLNKTQKKILQYKLKILSLAGVSLPKEKKERFVYLKQRLNQLGNEFFNNVVGAAQNYSLNLTEEEGTGLPKSSILLGKSNARKKDKEGLLFTLDLPSYSALVTFADSRDLRKRICKDYLTRASDKGYDKTWDNTEIIKEIMVIRKQIAEMFSLENFAEYSIARNMVKSTEQVMDFLSDMALKSNFKARRELGELKKIAAEDGISELKPWDVGTSMRYQGYYVEKLKQRKLEISQEEFREYFPCPYVMEGIFDIVNRLFGVTFKENKNIPVWHEDVRVFEIYNGNGELQGYIYLDLYYREYKGGGAWMNDGAPKRHIATDGKVKLPVTYLVCNFSPPVECKPSLLTHYELITFLHEMGHCLQHLLTKVDYISASGLNGLPEDAREIASTFMENWGWHEESLKLLSSHYQSKKTLPQSMIEKLMDNKSFQAGLNLLYQVEFSLIDFLVHLEQATTMEEFEKIIAKVQKQVRVAPAYENDRLLHYFTHLFFYGYEARYYSYLWSGVISSDLFSRFENEGILNQDLGKEFLEKFMALGGSEDPTILFRDFLGRDIKVDSFLRYKGIIGNGLDACKSN